MSQKIKLSETPYGIFAGNRHPIEHLMGGKLDAKVEVLEMLLSARDHTEKKNLAIFTIMHCARRTLPYGIWHCSGGRDVLFNREYQAIAQRIDGVVSYADRDEAIQDIEGAEMIYDDITNPARYLVKHLGGHPLTPSESKECRKALMRSLAVLRDFTPKEHVSVSRRWSLFG